MNKTEDIKKQLENLSDDDGYIGYYEARNFLQSNLPDLDEFELDEAMEDLEPDYSNYEDEEVFYVLDVENKYDELKTSYAKGGKIKMYDELQEYENDAQIGDKIYVGYGLAKKNITKPEYEVVGKNPDGTIKVRNYGSKAKKTFLTFGPQSYDEQVMVFSKGGKIDVVDERSVGKMKIIVLNDGKTSRTITFKDGVQNKFNRNKKEDIEKLWDLSGKVPYGTIVDKNYKFEHGGSILEKSYNPQEVFDMITQAGTWEEFMSADGDGRLEIYNNAKYRFEKGGKTISREEVVEVLKDKLEDVLEDANQEYEGQEITGEEVEYESRDGFIPYTDGGYEYRFFTYGNYLTGSGKSLPTNTLDAELERVENLNYEYGKERFEEEYPDIVKELGGIENVDYNSLSEAGYESEADDLDEFSRSDDDSIMFEVEAFYYKPDNDRGVDGKHTIVLSGSVNMEAPYHRTGNMEDYIQETFTFDSIKDLEDKLDKSIPKIEAWFDGDNYKQGKELKMGRFEKGGEVEKHYKIEFLDENEEIIDVERYGNTEPDQDDYYEMASKLNAFSGIVYSYDEDDEDGTLKDEGFYETDFGVFQYKKGGLIREYIKPKGMRLLSDERKQKIKEAQKEYDKKPNDINQAALQGQIDRAVDEVENRVMGIDGKYESYLVRYAKGGRILVGRFDEKQLKNKEDKKAIEKAQKESGLTYIDSKIIKKGGKMFMEVYLIPNEEYYKSSKFSKGGYVTSRNIKESVREYLMDKVPYVRKPVDLEEVNTVLDFTKLPDDVKTAILNMKKIVVRDDEDLSFFKSRLDGDIQFYILFIKGEPYLVDTQGYDYARYIVRIVGAGEELSVKLSNYVEYTPYAKGGIITGAGKPGLDKIKKISKDNPSQMYKVTDDNYTNIGTFYLKNGKFAKMTVSNADYDFAYNKVSLRPKRDVIYKATEIEGKGGYFAKGGKVKSNNNEMIIGGLAGILFGFLLNK